MASPVFIRTPRHTRFTYFNYDSDVVVLQKGVQSLSSPLLHYHHFTQSSWGLTSLPGPPFALHIQIHLIIRTAILQKQYKIV